MPVPLPSPDTRWRCTRCGNLTRFDVTRSSGCGSTSTWTWRVAQRRGAVVLEESIEQVRCRWCDAADTVELVPRAAAEEPVRG